MSSRTRSLGLALIALAVALIGLGIHLFRHPSFIADLLVGLSIALSGGAAAVKWIREGRAWAWAILIIVVAYPTITVVMHLFGQ